MAYTVQEIFYHQLSRFKQIIPCMSSPDDDIYLVLLQWHTHIILSCLESYIPDYIDIYVFWYITSEID